MRAGLLVALLFAVTCYGQQDVPVAVRKAFEARDASLGWFTLVGIRAAGVNSEVVVAEAAPMESDGVRPPAANMQKMLLGVFLLSRRSHQVQIAIDISRWSSDEYPELGDADTHSIRIYTRGDYGGIWKNIRYIYDASAPGPVTKIQYRNASLKSARREGGKLIYAAEYRFGVDAFSPRRVMITVGTTSTPGAVPSYVVAEDRSLENSRSEPLFHAGGEKLAIETWTGLSGVRVTDPSGKNEFFPAPVTHIGPVAFDGHTIWFASRFPDGEGYSSAGSIGTFDPLSRRYRLHKLPEIGTSSGTAILADGDNIWVGLEGREEEAGHSKGLVRYNRLTGVARKYSIDDVINTIDRVGNTIYCGTEDGLYTIQGDVIRHYRFEPDVTGKLVMTTRPRPLHPMADSHK